MRVLFKTCEVMRLSEVIVAKVPVNGFDSSCVHLNGIPDHEAGMLPLKLLLKSERMGWVLPAL